MVIRLESSLNEILSRSLVAENAKAAEQVIYTYYIHTCIHTYILLCAQYTYYDFS